VRLRTGLVAALALAALAPGPTACALRSRPAWELPPPPPRDAAVVEPGKLHRATLANGLRVIVLEDPRLPRFSAGVTFRRGAALEPLERAGLAGFTAELMERGAGDLDALGLAGVVDALGASLGSGADWDSLGVAVDGLSRDQDVLLRVLADVVRRPRFEPAEAEKVRAERLASLEQAKDEPEVLASRAFARALYPGHRYGLPADGTPEGLRGLTAADARAFHERVARPDDAIFWATGDVRAEDVLRRAEADYGTWSSGAAPLGEAPAPPDATPPERRVVVVDRPDLGQAQILVGHEGIARSDPDRLDAQLLNAVLGAGGFSSRLMGRVRAEEGLTYSVYSFFDMRRRPGPFGVSTFTRVAEVRRTLDLVLAELERVRRDPPSAGELADAQSLRAGQFALGLETSEAVTAALVDLDVHGLPEDTLDTYRARLRAVTAEHTARAAQRLVHPDRTAIVVVGPAAELVPQLEGLGTVGVVQP
jgi:zinc protease